MSYQIKVLLATAVFCILITLLFGCEKAEAHVGDDIQCHIDNIFFEGNSEPFLGKVLIANTVKNRTADKRWGKTDCETIYQPKQFSWTELTARQLREFKDRENKGYRFIKDNIGEILSYGDVPGFTGVNHYKRCDTSSNSGWENHMVFLGQVGAHCFYRD